MKIRTKIIILFSVSILLTTAVSVSATAYFGRRAYIDEVHESGEKTLLAMSDNIELTMKHIRQDTDAVFWNAVVQEKLEALKSALSGFGDTHYFGQCFKKFTGLTVNEFKKRKAKKSDENL